MPPYLYTQFGDDLVAWYLMKPHYRSHQCDPMSWPSTANANGADKEMKCTIVLIALFATNNMIGRKKGLLSVFIISPCVINAAIYQTNIVLYFTEPYLYYYFSKGRCYKCLYNIDVLHRTMLAFYTTIGQHYH